MLGLIADIGGTNARFAICAPGGAPIKERTLACADFPGPIEAAKAFLAAAKPSQPPSLGAFAVAAPVDGEEIRFTNNPWRFSVHGVGHALGLSGFRVVNDFVANALAAPAIDPDDRVQVGGAEPRSGHPVAVLGPGTGLGVALLIPSGRGWLPIATEGGHATLAAADDREAEVIALLRRRFGHVSAERAVSGGGLVNLARALAELRGIEPKSADPAEIAEHGAAGTCDVCREALGMFFAMLGTVAGNLALTSGAKGGVHVMGGIVPRHLETFLASRFRARFEAKGRFQSYLGRIPAFVVTHPNPAFVGLTALIGELAAAGEGHR